MKIRSILKSLTHFIEQGNYLSFLLLVASLPFSLLFIRIFWYIWLVTWLAAFLLNRQFTVKPSLTPLHYLLLFPLLGFAFFFLWDSLSLFWSINPQATLRAIGREWNLLCLIPIFLYGVSPCYKWQTVLKVLVYSSLISVFFYLLLHYHVLNAQLAIDKFSMQSPANLNLFTLDNLLLNVKHRIYYSLVIIMSLAALFLLFSDRQTRLTPIQNYLYTSLAALFLLLGIYWSGSRIALLVVFFIAFVPLYLRLSLKQRLFATLSAFLLLFILIFSINQLRPREGQFSLQERLAYNPTDTLQPANEIRVAIWHTVFENRSDYPFYGLGANCSQTYLTQKYTEKHWSNYAVRRFSTHNQFLALWLELGPLAPLLLFLFFTILLCSTLYLISAHLHSHTPTTTPLTNPFTTPIATPITTPIATATHLTNATTLTPITSLYWLFTLTLTLLFCLFVENIFSSQEGIFLTATLLTIPRLLTPSAPAPLSSPTIQ